MYNKLLSVLAFGIIAALTPVRAQSGSPAGSNQVPGKIIVARVVGAVTASSPGSGSKMLHTGDEIAQDYTVSTSSGASVVLVFSNGSALDLGPDSSLNITTFEQDPFAADIKPGDLKSEPSTSKTRLNLLRGELVGKVVHLNRDQGSSYEVETPVGAAGIRGTIFKIKVTDVHGKITVTVTVTEGNVTFTYKTTLTNKDLGIPSISSASFSVPSNENQVVDPTVTTAQVPPGDQADIQEVVDIINGVIGGLTFTKVTPPAPYGQQAWVVSKSS
jgi:hypothetical protein